MDRVYLIKRDNLIYIKLAFIDSYKKYIYSDYFYTEQVFFNIESVDEFCKIKNLKIIY